MHEGKVESVFQADSFPLGMFPHAEFKPASHTLAPGDTLVLSTDGVKEAMNLKEEEFGMERLQDVIAQTPDARSRSLRLPSSHRSKNSPAEPPRQMISPF